MEIMVFLYDGFELVIFIDFGFLVLGQQYVILQNMEVYVDEIVFCWIFVFLWELEMFFEYNLIKGGDLDNVIVIVDNEVLQEQLDCLVEKLG